MEVIQVSKTNHEDEYFIVLRSFNFEDYEKFLEMLKGLGLVESLASEKSDLVEELHVARGSFEGKRVDVKFSYDEEHGIISITLISDYLSGDEFVSMVMGSS